MLRLQVEFRRPFILIAALVVGFAQASAKAGAAASHTDGQASQLHRNPSSRCSGNEAAAALSQASALMQQSRFQDASSSLLPLSARNCDARVSLLLAAAFEGQGNIPKATDILLKAQSVWPANDSVSASLARIFFNSGDKQQAVKALARFHGTAETPEQELEMAAVVYLAANRLVRAQTVAEKYYDYHPSMHSLLLLANTLQMQGRYPDVNRILESRRETYGDSPEFLVTLAESESDASLLTAARDDLQRAISLNPEMPQAHYLLGNVLASLSEQDGAISEYRRAIQLEPNQARTYYQLALVLRTKQDNAGERTALKQAVAVDDRYAPAHCELGRMLLDDDHQPADAAIHLLKAIQYNPRSEEAYFLLARAYTKMGERDKANETVKRLEAIKRENRLTHAPGHDVRNTAHKEAELESKHNRQR